MNRMSFFQRVVSAVSALALIGLAVSALAGPAAASGTPTDFGAIDDYVRTQLQSVRVPGAVLGIVQGEQLVHLQAFGVADSSGRPVTPQTPFFLGSITKSFTALAIMQLVEAGQIELDAPAQRYLPWFRLADAQASATITVRQLLYQTSGLPKSAGLSDLDSLDDGPNALEQHVRAMSSTPLARAPGAAFEYSNANYDILGLIVQTVSGQPYGAYVQTHIFTPLGMRQSFSSHTAALPHGMAAGHQYWFGLPVQRELPYPQAMLPSGFLIASAEDMTHYLIAQLNGGRYGGASILSPSGIAALHRPAVSMGAPGTGYGMGWFSAQANGVAVVGHNGDTSNFHSYMLLVPQAGWGIVLLMNASNLEYMERQDQIAVGVVSLLAGRQPPAPAPMNEFYRNTLVFVAVLLCVMAISGWQLWHWRQPARRPRSTRQRLARLGWPLLVCLGIVWLFLFSLPQALETTLAQVVFRRPDLGWTAVLTAAVALAWGFGTTLLAVQFLWQPVPGRRRSELSHDLVSR